MKVYLQMTAAALRALALTLGLASAAMAADDPAAPKKDIALKGDAVCTRCHDESDSYPVLAIAKTQHGTVADSRAPTCTSCHGESQSHVQNLKKEGESGRPKPDRTFTGQLASVPASDRVDRYFGQAGKRTTTPVGDLTWTGTARLVAIDRAEPHANRRGAVLIMPQERVRLLDVRVRDGRLEAMWAPRVAAGRPPLSTPAEGTLRADLVDGGASLAADAVLPPPVRRALLGLTLRAPPFRGHASWRAGDGWSAIAMVKGVPVLHHWPDEGEPITMPLLEAGEVDGFALEHVDRRCAVLRVCAPDAPGRDELRLVDAVVGAIRPSVPAADLDGRLVPPFGTLGDDLLAVRLTASGRVLVRIDTDTGAERWRRPLPPLPKA